MLPLGTFLLLITASLINGLAAHPRSYSYDLASLNKIRDASSSSSSTVNPRGNPCPDFRQPSILTAFLGADANDLGKCSWRIKFTCAALLATCPVNCVLAVAEGGLNPILDGACVTCMGASAASCSECFEKDVGLNDVCGPKAVSFPDAHCIEPVCSQIRTTS